MLRLLQSSVSTTVVAITVLFSASRNNRHFFCVGVGSRGFRLGSGDVQKYLCWSVYICVYCVGEVETHAFEHGLKTHDFANVNFLKTKNNNYNKIKINNLRATHLDA